MHVSDGQTFGLRLLNEHCLWAEAGDLDQVNLNSLDAVQLVNHVFMLRLEAQHGSTRWYSMY